MNLSGIAVRMCADYYDLKPGGIVVIHDDLDLPVGRIKIVRNGGSGGHKGVSSIIQHLGSRHFPRIKVGIGRPRHEEDVEDFVLSPLYKDERQTMDTVFQGAIRGCELLVSEGLDRAMNQINCQIF
jgi:PTH1 family peptidyl-tRNA hydrolase